MTALRLSIVPGCVARAGPGGAGRRPGATLRRRRGRTFTPPAGFGFAFGTVSKVAGSTVTIEARRAATAVVLTDRTQITRTVSVQVSAVKPKLCAFVRGTSSDRGVTVRAQQVQLSQPVHGACGFRRR